jgi:Adenylate kinase
MCVRPCSELLCTVQQVAGAVANHRKHQRLVCLMQGTEIQELMNEGAIVPFEITINLIHKAMQQSDVKRFLIDGFPRAVDQAQAFEANVCKGKAMLFLDCPEEVMEVRPCFCAQACLMHVVPAQSPERSKKPSHAASKLSSVSFTGRH